MPLKLLKGIRHFKNHVLKKEEELFASLSKGQSPDVLFITCSDSRLSPHSFTHSGLGELFMARNPGNIVPPYSDMSMPSGEASAIEFALTYLNCQEVIVCGHSYCGAMNGLLSSDLEKQLPHTAAWLSPSRLLVDHIKICHPDIKEHGLMLMHLTLENILLQMEYLKTYPAVAKRLAEGTLKIHGWYYEIETGEVHIYNPQKKAFISFEQTVKEVATEKLNQIVEQEAQAYLMSLSNPKSQDNVDFVKTCNKVRFLGVSPIWMKIEANVRLKLLDQIGGLYAMVDGSINPSFEELVKKGPLIKLETFDNLTQAIKKAQAALPPVILDRTPRARL